MFLQFSDGLEPILDGLHLEAQVGQSRAGKRAQAVVVFE